MIKLNLFPTQYRYSGIALSRELNSVIFAGSTPVIAEAIITLGNGEQTLLIYYLMFFSLLTLVAVEMARGLKKHHLCPSENSVKFTNEVTMNITITENKNILGLKAAEAGILAMQNALAQKEHIAIILATGASQFQMLEKLIEADIDWSRVTIFYLDEYIRLSDDHPASFRRYLQERVVEKLPALRQFVAVNGSAEDIKLKIERLNRLIGAQTIDVCFAGIGENGHLVFNDPPADFTTTVPYLKVTLDDACRQGEKWFSRIEEVPSQAISMSINQIMLSEVLILSIPDVRKAQAVKLALQGPVVNTVPASIVQYHPACQVFLDNESASLITER